MSSTKHNVVCFGVEVSSITDQDSDVLQIAMKCGSAIFNEYIDPTTSIDIKQSEINHIRVRDWHLYRNGAMLPSRPLRMVLQRLLDFLKQFKQPSILIRHKNCLSDARHLVRVILKESMETEFGKVILGFRDTFGMFEKKFPTRKHDLLTLHRLGYEAQLKWSHTLRHGRCVKHCAAVLEKVMLHYFDEKDVTVQKSFSEILEQEIKLEKKAERKKIRESENQQGEEVAAKQLRKQNEQQEGSIEQEEDENGNEEKRGEAVKLSKKAIKKSEKKEAKLARLKSQAASKKSKSQVCLAGRDNHAPTNDGPNIEESEIDMLVALYEDL